MQKPIPGSVLAAAALILASAAPALAHHSYAMFDKRKVVTLSGVVSVWQFTNPHSALFIYVKGPNGRSELWGLESVSPGSLSRLGVKKNTVKPGDKVTVTLNPLRDGRKGGSLISARLPSGKTIQIGQLPSDKVNQGPQGPSNEPRRGERH